MAEDTLDPSRCRCAAASFEAARVRDELADKVLTLQAELGEAQYQWDVARSVRDMARNALTATEYHVKRMGERWDTERRRAEDLTEQLRQVTQERDAARADFVVRLTRVTAEKQAAERALERAREALYRAASDG